MDLKVFIAIDTDNWYVFPWWSNSNKFGIAWVLFVSLIPMSSYVLLENPCKRKGVLEICKWIALVPKCFERANLAASANSRLFPRSIFLFDRGW